MRCVEECLNISMPGLLTPIAIGLLRRLGDRGSQRLALADCRFRLQASRRGNAAELVQGCSKGTGRWLCHGRSKVLRGASGAG
jgi:hypothetical protein